MDDNLEAIVLVLSFIAGLVLILMSGFAPKGSGRTRLWFGITLVVIPIGVVFNEVAQFGAALGGLSHH